MNIWNSGKGVAARGHAFRCQIYLRHAVTLLAEFIAGLV
jgi:hypothetical protein